MKHIEQGQTVECRLVCSSSSNHLYQLYGGFGMLARRGLVRVTAARATQFALGPYVHPRLEVLLNGQTLLVYDAYDGANFLEEPLANCHLYFKRSYSPDRVSAHPHGHKIVPLGLNYIMYGPADFWFKRALWSFPVKRPFLPAVRQFIQASGILSRILNVSNGRFDCAFENFEGEPKISPQPRILLLTRTWDPAQVSGKTADVEERHYMNQMRAACIRKLHDAFGEQFIGGFTHSRHALENFPDCVASDPRQTNKAAFIRLVHESDICVTTLGLRQSNGFRLAEYVAASRSIVTERMRHSAPGDFEAGKNYLDFTTPDECVAAVHALVDDPARRLAMMQSNQAYYYGFLRPDVLVWNTLQTAMMRHPSSG